MALSPDTVTAAKIEPTLSFSQWDGDTLLLQYLHTPLDIAKIQVANPFAQELVQYADRERARVSR